MELGSGTAEPHQRSHPQCCLLCSPPAFCGGTRQAARVGVGALMGVFRSSLWVAGWALAPRSCPFPRLSAQDSRAALGWRGGGGGGEERGGTSRIIIYHGRLRGQALSAPERSGQKTGRTIRPSQFCFLSRAKCCQFLPTNIFGQFNLYTFVFFYAGRHAAHFGGRSSEATPSFRCSAIRFPIRRKYAVHCFG